jgi:hypothetical protein
MARRIAALVLVMASTVTVVAAAPAAKADLPSVVAKWLAATGGAKAWGKCHGVTLRGEVVESGIHGTWEAYLSRDGLRRVTTQEGDVREEVSTGSSVWERDWNGHVWTLQGRDWADKRAEALMGSLLYSGNVPLGTNDAAAFKGENEAGTQWIVRLETQGVTPIDVYVDKASGLPVKLVRKPYDDDIVWEPSEWKAFKKLKVPMVVKVSGDDNEASDTWTVRELVPHVEPGTALARPKDGPRDSVLTNGPAKGIPFNFENDHLMVDVSVNGRPPVWFMIDSGAESTIINKPRMAEFGLTPFGATITTGGGNSTDYAYTKTPKLTLPGIEITNQRHGVMDMSGLEKIYGRAMGGILGYDFLSRFVVRVDYDTKTIDVLDNESFEYRGPGTRLPFIVESGHPHVRTVATVLSGPPIDADMVIDNGAADTVNMARPWVMANDLLTRARKTPAGAPNVMAGSEKEFFAQTSVRGRLSSLTLGTYRLTDIPGNLMVAKTGAYASTEFSATIGEGILKRFNAVYDYRRNVIHLEPNAEMAKPFPGRKTFGATYLSDGPDYRTFKVTGIRKDSPAEAAGLKKDDILVALDGKPAAELRLADIRAAFAVGSEGAKRTVTVKRGEETVTIEVVVALVPLDES